LHRAACELSYAVAISCSFTLTESQPEKGEATSDDDGDPAYRLRH